MGLAGLTAVFGMGTGVTPPVWSPGKGPAGLCAPPDSCQCGIRALILLASAGGSRNSTFRDVSLGIQTGSR
jgi:hypothetical protein